MLRAKPISNRECFALSSTLYSCRALSASGNGKILGRLEGYRAPQNVHAPTVKSRLKVCMLNVTACGRCFWEFRGKQRRKQREKDSIGHSEQSGHSWAAGPNQVVFEPHIMQHKVRHDPTRTASCPREMVGANGTYCVFIRSCRVSRNTRGYECNSLF